MVGELGLRPGDLGRRPLVNHSWPDASEEVRDRLIQGAFADFNSAQEEFATSRTLFLEDTGKIFNDAFSDNPESKVSRLFQNIKEFLEKKLS